MSKKLIEYFNKQPRLGCMSTSGKDGKVNTLPAAGKIILPVMDEALLKVPLEKRPSDNCKAQPD
jgi:hypothetical protein